MPCLDWLARGQLSPSNQPRAKQARSNNDNDNDNEQGIGHRASGPSSSPNWPAQLFAAAFFPAESSVACPASRAARGGRHTFECSKRCRKQSEPSSRSEPVSQRPRVWEDLLQRPSQTRRSRHSAALETQESLVAYLSAASNTDPPTWRPTLTPPRRTRLPLPRRLFNTSPCLSSS